MDLDLFPSFKALKDIKFNDNYTTHLVNGNKHIEAFETALRERTATDKAVLDPLMETVKSQAEILKAEGKTKSELETAQVELRKAEEKIRSFLRGETIEGVEAKVSDDLKKAFVAAETETDKLVKSANSFFGGMVRTQKNGFVEALKKNTQHMKFYEKGLEAGERGLRFAHGSAVVGAAIGLGDAAFRSKTNEGEDRSGAMRVIEAVGAGMLGTAALLGGKAALARA